MSELKHRILNELGEVSKMIKEKIEFIENTDYLTLTNANQFNYLMNTMNNFKIHFQASQTSKDRQFNHFVHNFIIELNEIYEAVKHNTDKVNQDQSQGFQEQGENTPYYAFFATLADISKFIEKKENENLSNDELSPLAESLIEKIDSTLKLKLPDEQKQQLLETKEILNELKPKNQMKIKY